VEKAIQKKADTVYILVLSDSLNKAKKIDMILNDAGFVSTLAHVAKENDYRTSLKTSTYDLIISDFGLPEMDIFKALQLRNEICPDTALLCFSEELDGATVAELFKLGMEDYLPAQKEEKLAATVMEILKKRYKKNVSDRAEVNYTPDHALYQSIFESTGTATLIVDEDTTIVMANKESYQVTGYSAEELKGTKWTSFAAPESLELMLKNHQLRRKEPYKAPKKYEVFLIHKNGEKKTVILSVAMIPRSKQSIVSILDISDRKQAQKELLDSRKNWEAIFNGLTHPTIILDAEQNVIDLNQSLLKLLGKDISEIKKLKCWEIFHSKTDCPPEGCPFQKMKKTGKAETYEMQMEAMGGTYLISCTPLYDPEGKLERVIHIATNLTGLKEAESSLQESEARFSAFMENLPTTTFIKDRQQRILFVNKEMRRIFHAQDWVGKSLYDVFPPDIAQSLIEADNASLEKGFGSHRHMVPDAKGNQRIWETYIFGIKRIGKEPLTGGFSMDITEREQKEAQLARSEKLFRTLFLDAQTPVFMVDEKSRTYIDANQAALDFLECSKEELTGRSVYDFSPPEIRKETIEKHKNFSKSKTLETHYLIKGKEKILLLEVTPLELDNKPVLLGIGQDITQRKKAEEQIKRNESRLQSLTRILQHPCDTVQDFLDYALDESIKLTESKIGYIYFYDEQKKEFTLNTWSKGVLDECSISDAPNIYHLKKTGIWGEVVRQRKEIIVNDFQADNPLKKGYPEGHAPLYKFLSIPVFSDNEIVAVLGLANKITDYDQNDVLQIQLLIDSVWKEVERKKGETKLRESEEKFQTLMNQTPEALFLHTMDGSIVEYNRIVLERYGYSAEEILCLKTQDIDPDFVKREEDGIFWENLHRKGKITFEASHRRKDGSVFPVKVRLAPIELKGEKYGLALVEDMTEYKNAEKKLLNIQQRLEEAEQIGKLGHVNWDVEKQEAYWSEEVFRIYDIDKHTGPPSYQEIMALHEPEDSLRLEEAVRKAIEEGIPYSLDCRSNPANGDVKYLHIIGKPMVKEDGIVTHIRGTVQDISNRKKAEEELLEIKNIYQALFENSLIGIGIATPDGIIQENNKAFAAMLGYNIEDIKLMNAKDFYLSEEERKKIEKTIIRHKTLINYETKLKRKDGVFIDVLLNISLVNLKGKTYYQTSCQNITKRKEIERALIQNEAFTRAVLDNLPVGIAVNSVEPEIIFEYMNNNFPLMYRTTREALSKPDSFWETVYPDPEFREKIKKRVLADCASGDPQRMIWKDIPIIRKGEETSYITARNTPVPNEKLMISTVIDVSNRKKAEMEILQLNKELEERVKVRTAELETSNKELEAFSYTVSHDLKAPLRAIDGFTTILLDKYKDKIDHDGIRMGAIIHENIRKMAQLIHDLLAFSRLNRGQINKTEIDMKNMALSVFDELVQAQDRDRIEFSMAEISNAHGDPGLILQVWRNLISNAVKYSSKKSKALIEINCTKKPGFLVYSVKDNGVGFNMDYKDKLFGVFERLHSQDDFEGTGVGLASVQRIINRHGGSVWAESKPDEGAVFYFSLPVENADNA
jgi:PAS domain S-box-containing protein